MDVAEAVLMVLGEIAAGTSAAKLEGKDVLVKIDKSSSLAPPLSLAQERQNTKRIKVLDKDTERFIYNTSSSFNIVKRK